MKVFALLFALTFSLLSGYVSANQCKELRVHSTHGWYPITYTDPEGDKAIGIANDLTRWLGNQLNVQVTIDIKTPWNRMLHHLKQGNIDMISAIYLTEERKIWYRYTDHYFVNQARVFVLKENKFPLSGLDDLIGRTGIIPLGGSFGDKFDNFVKEQNLNIITMDSKAQKGRMLIAGRADYFVQDYLDGMTYLKENKLEGKIVALPYPISTTNVHFALSRQSPCLNLIPKINKLIEQAKQDGTLQTILDKYL